MKITETAFTAVQQWDGSKPIVLTWATARTATDVRKEVGEAYAMDEDESAERGWQRARKAGVRVVKVEMTANVR